MAPPPVVTDVSTRSSDDAVREVVATGSRQRLEREDRRPQDSPASQALSEPDVFGSVDANVDAVRAQARSFASRQRYDDAFTTLAPFVSPSAPAGLIIECAEYAFAAGRWQDAARVASQRLRDAVPTDTAQERARLYDIQGRAEAILRAPAASDR